MKLLQEVSFIFTVFDIFLCIILMKFYINSRIYLYNAIVYLIHILIFYSFVFSERYDGFIRPYHDFFTNWSAMIRFHGLIAIMFVLLYFVKWKRVNSKIINIKNLIRGKLWKNL